MNIQTKFLCLILTVFLCSCTLLNHDSDLTPEAEVAALLHDHRVVMVGDSGHGKAQPRHGLLRVLDAWLENLQSDDSTPRNLTLVLEVESELSALISDYTKTGQWAPLLDFLLPYSTLESFEFYAGLRQVQQRVSEIPSASLSIIGKEPGSARDDTGWSTQESYRYFITHRDSLTATGILEHIRNNPDNGVLIFYGNAHLTDGWVDKTLPAQPNMESENSYGFWLAHYLKQDLGPDQVVTIDQILMSSHLRNRDESPADTLMNWVDIPTNHHAKRNPEQNRDMAIMRTSMKVMGHPLRNIACRSVVEAQLKEMRRVDPLRVQEFLADRDAARFRDALSLFSYARFETIEQWQNWWSPSEFDWQAVIRKGAFPKHVIELMEAVSEQDEGAVIRLLEIGLSRRVVMSILSGRVTDFEQVWQQASDQIMALQSIGIWWCGDDSEQKSARLFLEEFSGQKFRAPDEALRWWRQVYQGTDY